MPNLRIAVADDAAGTERSAWWCAAIAERWPHPGPGPTCRGVSYEGMATQLLERSGIGGDAGGAAVVLWDGSAGDRTGLMQLLDRVIVARTPTVVLAAEPEGVRLELESLGVPVLGLGSDPAVVALVVHTLTTRQAAVDQLATELHIARASQGGLSGEIGKLHEELQLAGSVQRRCLPKQMPELPGYEFGVFFRPCGFVSGDIYDAVRIDAQRVAFILADAVGHGVPAALLALVLSRALRSIEHEGSDAEVLASPAATLARLNRELCEENDVGDRFATAVCGVIDAGRGVVTLASAGHPPALVIGADGSAAAVEGGEGPLLGVFPEAEFVQTTFAIVPGQSLLLFSDGFETAFPEPGASPDKAAASLAYVEHFAQAASDAGGERGGAQAALERLAMDVDSQAGSLNQRDDLTALALRRLPDARCAASTARGRAAA